MSKLLAVAVIGGAIIVWHKLTFNRFPWEPAPALKPIRVALRPMPTPTRLPTNHERGAALTPEWRLWHGAYGSIRPQEQQGTFG